MATPAAEAMRRILLNGNVHGARHRTSVAGGGERPLDIEGPGDRGWKRPKDDELLAVDEALTELPPCTTRARRNWVKAPLFRGPDHWEETAQTLDISVAHGQTLVDLQPAGVAA